MYKIARAAFNDPNKPNTEDCGHDVVAGVCVFERTG